MNRPHAPTLTAGPVLRSRLSAALSSLLGGRTSFSGVAVRSMGVSLGGTGLRFITQVMLARWLGAAAYGVFVVARGWGEMLSRFPNRGYYLTLVRYLPAYDERRAWPEYRGLLRTASVETTLLGVLLAAFAAAFAAATGNSGVPLLLALALIPVVAYMVLQQTTLQALDRYPSALAVSELVQPLVLAALVGGLVWSGLVDPASAMAAYGASLLLGVVLLWVLVRRAVPAAARGVPPVTLRPTWLRTARPMYVAQLSIAALGTADVLAIGGLMGVAEAGTYAAAARIAVLGQLVIVAVEQVAAPQLSRAHSIGDRAAVQRIVDQSIRLAILPTAAFSFAVVGLGWSTLDFLGEEFAAARWVLLLLLLGNIAPAVSGPVGFVVSLAGAEKTYARVMAAHAVIGVALVVVVARIGTIEATATVTALARISWNVWLARVAWKRLGVRCWPRLRLRYDSTVAGARGQAGPIQQHGVGTPDLHFQGADHAMGERGETTADDDGLEPVPAVVRTLARYAAPVVVFAAFVAAAATLVDRGSPSGSATARVGLTSAVGWPFYDAARDRQMNTLREDREAIIRATSDPAGVGEITAEIPVNQAFIDIIATATTPQLAAEAVTAAADHLVATDRQRLQSSLEAERAAAQRSADAAAGMVAEREVELSQLIDQEAQLLAQLRIDPGSEVETLQADIGRLQLVRSAVEAYRNEAIRRQVVAEADVARLDLQLAAAVPEVEVLRYPEPPTPTDRVLALERGVGAGFAALVVGTLAALVWDRERARLRRPGQLRGGGPPMLGSLGTVPAEVGASSTTVERSALTSALLLHEAAKRAGARVVGVASLGEEPLTPALDRLRGGLVEAGCTVATVGAGPAPGTTELWMEDAVLTLDQPTGTSFASAPLHVRWSPHHLAHIAFAREVIARLAANFEVVLVECGPPDGSSTWLAAVRNCDAAVIVAPLRRVRVGAVRRAAQVVERSVPHLGVVTISPSRSTPRASSAASSTRPADTSLPARR